MHSRTDTGDETILRIEGTLDAATAPDVRTVIDAIVNEGRVSVTLELSSLCLIDGMGIGMIISLFKRIRANGGQVKLQGLRDQPRAIFRVLRLDRVFPST